MSEEWTEEEPKKAEIVSLDQSYLSLVRGEVDAQIATAKRFPRSISQFKEEARRMACLDHETAQECVYALPRGGKSIQGPSARFAEIVSCAWRNVRKGSRVIGIDNERVTVQAVCLDLETNVATSMEVMRRITDSKGRRFSDDMIVVTTNAASSIARRNAVLSTIPKAYWKPVFDQACELLRKGNGAKPLEDQRKEAFSYFQKLGVSSERILATLGKRKLEDVDFEDVATLRGLATALKEGDTTPEEAFQATPGVKKSKDIPSVAEVVNAQREPGEDEPEAPKENIV